MRFVTLLRIVARSLKFSGDQRASAQSVAKVLPLLLFLLLLLPLLLLLSANC